MSRIFVLVCLFVALTTSIVSGNELENAYPSAGDSDGLVVVEEGYVFVIGTDWDDEIEVIIRERSVKISINGDDTTLRRNEFVPELQLDETRFRVFVLGHGGEDSIEFTDDIDEDDESFTTSFDLFQLIAIGGTGDDTIINKSLSYTGATLVGGFGRDRIFAGINSDLLAGGDVEVEMEGHEIFTMTPVPDFQLDDLVGWKNANFIADYWMSIEAPLPVTVHRLVAPKQISGFEIPRGPMIQNGRWFSSVRLERDNIISYSSSNSMTRTWYLADGSFDRYEFDW